MAQSTLNSKLLGWNFPWIEKLNARDCAANALSTSPRGFQKKQKLLWDGAGNGSGGQSRGAAGGDVHASLSFLSFLPCRRGLAIVWYLSSLLLKLLPKLSLQCHLEARRPPVLLGLLPGREEHPPVLLPAMQWAAAFAECGALGKLASPLQY